MRKATAILVCLLLIAGIVPLFSGGRSEEGATAASELRIMWWGSQRRHELTIGAIDEYTAGNPGLNVNYEFAGWQDYWTRLTTMAAGGDLPDIIQQDYAYLSEWQARNQLLPLDSFISSGVLDLSNVDDGLLQGGRIGGQLYGLNLGSNAESIVMDRAVFEAAGVEIPAWDWTWDDFEETVLAIREATGIWGIGGNLYNEQIWQSIYLSLGEDAYNAEGTGVGYSDDGPLVRHFEMLLRLQEADAIPHISEHLASYHEQGVEAAPIVAGDAAMEYLWSNQIIALWNAAGADRDMVIRPIPRVAGGEAGVYIKPSMFFSITRTARNPEAAAAFLSSFTNDVGINRILLAERGVPIAAPIRADLADRITAIEATVFEYIAEVPNWASPIPPPEPAGHGDIINNVYNPRVAEAILFGQTTPQRGAEILRQEVASILGSN